MDKSSPFGGTVGGNRGPASDRDTWGGIMTRRRSISLVAVAFVASAALGAHGASAAPPVEADAGAVVHWNQVAAIHARRRSRTERRCATRVPDQHGHDPGRGVRRGQCDRAQAPSALPAPPALRGEGVDGRGRGDSRLRRALGARLDRAGASAVPGPRRAPADALLRIRSLARCDRRWPLQEPGHRRRARSSRRHARGEGERRTVRGVASGMPDTSAGHWWPLLKRLGSRSSTRPLGGRGRAVPHRELLAVPHRATARARQRRLRGGAQRRQGSGPSHGLDPDG